MTRTSPSYFDHLYAQHADPWGFETRWYEERKYHLTLATLPRRSYRRAFEPGCSIGVLTEMLAGRVEELIAVDAAAAPLPRARRRCASHPNVHIDQLSIPEQWPDGQFDLIVVSEVAYYFTSGELGQLLDHCTESLTPGGDLVAVHWRLETDYPMTGDEVHDALRHVPRLTPLARYEEPSFAIDVVRALERA